jgi:hypothetical protein
MGISAEVVDVGLPEEGSGLMSPLEGEEAGGIYTIGRTRVKAEGELIPAAAVFQPLSPIGICEAAE